MALISSFSQNLDTANRGGTEPKKKLKKLRSIRLSKPSSLKPSTKWDWSPCEFSSNDSSPNLSSPNYIKSTSCSNEKKESSQGGSESEYSSVSSSTYGSAASTPSSLHQEREFKGEIERKKMLTNSRTKKLESLGSFRPSRRHAKSRFDQPSISLLDDVVIPQHKFLVEVSDASPNYLKAAGSSDGKKVHNQASPRNSESSRSSFQSTLASSSQKPVKTLTRTSSLRTVRTLKNKTSFKSKRPSMEKCSEISQELSIDKNTCSSTLKDLKSPEKVELQPGETESERISVMKVCRYHHCSLNGHCHANVSPPTRFLYKRRHSLTVQRSMKPKSLSTLAPKRYSDRKREFQTSQNVSQDGANASMVAKINGQPRAESFRGASQENEDADPAEIPFAETSHHEKSFQDNLNQIRNSPPEEQDILETLTEVKETSLECGNIKTKLDKSISETVDIVLKSEERVVSNVGDNISTSTGNNFDLTDLCSSALSLKPDDKFCTCSEEVSNLNSELSADEPAHITKGSTPNDFGETMVGSAAISSASDSHPFEELNATREEKTGDSEPDSECVNGFTQAGDSNSRGFIPVGDCEANAIAHEANKPQFNKENQITMWHLIQQPMVAGLPAKAATQPLQGADEEKRMEDASTLPATKSSGLCPDFSEADMGTENHGTISQEVELHKTFVIKLVQEAIEKILLPEVQDHSSDDQSNPSGVISDQEIFEKHHGDGRELKISTSTESAKHNFSEYDNNKVGEDTSFDSKEASREANSFTGKEEEKAETKVRNKSDNQTPKGWNYLKKFILLKRFIKELEKAKKFDPRKLRHLPLEPEPEAEKVCLRHQMMGEMNNKDEWMLDYALQQVVSQLAPTQKRKVALLVKAFETVVPPQEDQPIQVTVPKLEDSNREFFSIKSELDESASEVNDTDWKAEEMVASHLVHGDSGSTTVYKQYDLSDLSTPMIKLESNDNVRDSYEKLPLDENAQEVHEDIFSSLNYEHHSGGSKLSGKIVGLDDLGYATGEPFSITNSSITDGDIESNAAETIESTSDCGPSEQLTADKEEKNRESKQGHVVREFPPLIGPKPKCSAKVAHNTQLDKQNRIRMWHVIYQHVVSGIAAKVGNQVLDDGSDDDANKLPEVKTSDLTKDYEAAEENHDASDKKIEFSQSNAVKLVQEVIDEILIPEIQDESSDAQSNASNVHLEKSPGDGGELRVLSSTDYARDSFKECNISKVEDDISLDQEEQGSAVGNITTPEEERAASTVENKSEQQRPKSWGKLKKLILLQRSIKALENARKFNSKSPPQQLPLTRDPEAEKVDLRHQMLDEKKKAEQWMLDYAVQHIVTKLTPARKRRVAMLVEAFEAVVPLPEI